MGTIGTWLLAAALHFAPPDKHPHFEGHEETLEQATTRYAQIASDIEKAVEGRKDAKTAAALTLAWAIGESALAHDADVGPCYRQGAWKLRCDGGHAAGPWQLHEYWDRTAKERVTVRMIFADRERSARMAVKGLTGAWSQCAHLTVEDRLSAFGLGHCEAGNASVRARYKLWRQVQSWEPPKDDAASSTSMNDQNSKAIKAITGIVDFFGDVVGEAESEVRAMRLLLEQQARHITELTADLENARREERALCVAAVERRLIDASPAGHEVGSSAFKDGLRAALLALRGAP